METSLKVGRGLALVGVLFVVLGCAVMVGFGAPIDVPLDLEAQARTNLQNRLAVQADAIALESIAPLSFPCPPPNDCQGSFPGYVIRLRVDDVVYEYNGKRVGQTSILWHEVSDVSAK